MLRTRDILFGEIAVALHFLSRPQLDECLALQRDAKPRRRLGAVCLDLGYLDDQQVEHILTQQARVVGRR